MPIHIEEIVTDVQMETAPAGGGTNAQELWQQLAQLRTLHQRMLDDAQRTGARGNED